MEDFINYICLDLKIKAPPVVDGIPDGLSPTAAAATNFEKIYIKDSRTLSPDVLFSVAHEMRHIWQAQNAPDIYHDYKGSCECGSTDAYNMQAAELDANAYGAYIIYALFGVLMTFDNLSRDVRSAIYNRAQLMLDADYENTPSLKDLYTQISTKS